MLRRFVRGTLSRLSRRHEDGELEPTLEGQLDSDTRKDRRPDFAAERIRQEIADSFDEELEMEIDESRFETLFADLGDHPDRKQLERPIYFRELFRLQHELVRLQDWVVHKGLKIVVIFEGRDSAGKGGAIKADHPAAQSPRLPGCRPAGAEQARAHAVVLSALCLAPAGSGRDRAV